jgi:hypothetical protein
LAKKKRRYSGISAEEEDEDSLVEDDEEFADKEHKVIKQVGWPIDKQDIIIGLIILIGGIFIGYLISKSIYRKEAQSMPFPYSINQPLQPPQVQASSESQDIIQKIMDKEKKQQMQSGQFMLDGAQMHESWIVVKNDVGDIVDCYKSDMEWVR